MTGTPPPEYRTTASVCEEYRCDRSTLSRWVKEGAIVPAMRMPGPRGALLFDAAEVERFRTLAAERLARQRAT